MLTQDEYYDVNRAAKTLLYTDHMIYSPDVPFFRDEDNQFLTEPYFASVITAPAPNAGQIKEHETSSVRKIQETLHRRVGQVLALCDAREHRTLLLGAWGCGVFQNEPVELAQSFKTWLESERFTGAFERVVFAVYDPSKAKANLKAFEAVFPG